MLMKRRRTREWLLLFIPKTCLLKCRNVRYMTGSSCGCRQRFFQLVRYHSIPYQQWAVYTGFDHESLCFCYIFLLRRTEYVQIYARGNLIGLR